MNYKLWIRAVMLVMAMGLCAPGSAIATEEEPPGIGGGDDCPSGGNIDGDCGSDGPSATDLSEESIIDTVTGWVSDFFDYVSGKGPDAENTDAVTTGNVDETLQANGEVTGQNGELAKPGDISGCPVELYSGCKVTRSTDWSESILPMDRKHRTSHGSAWSLGAGWHSAIDSRIIYGVDIDISSEIAAMQLVVNGYNEIIDEGLSIISAIENDFVNELGYNRPGAQEAMTDGIATIEAEIAPYIVLRDAAQSKLTELVAAQALSDSYREKNQYVIDQSYPAEFEIGVGQMKWISPSGNRYIFNLETDGTVSAASGNNNTLTILSDESIQVRTPDGNLFNYNPEGFLTSVYSRDSRSVVVQRDDNHKPTLLTDELGRTLAFSYLGERLNKLVDAAGRITEFDYSNHQLSQVIQFDGQTQTYAYTYAEEPLALTAKSDGEGNIWSYTYRQQDGQTVVDVQTDAAGSTFNYNYNFDGKSTVVTHRNGETSSYTYDDNNKTTSILRSADGSIVSFTYDEQGNRLSRTNGEQETTSFTYNDKNEVLTVTDGEGRVTYNLRDDAGRIISQTNNKGESTEFVYDSNGKVDYITLADGSVIEETWQNGLLTFRIDEAGNTTSYEYDAYGYPIRIEYSGPLTAVGDETVITSEYDAVGRALWVKEGANSLPESEWRETTYSYDAADGRSLNKPTSITDPIGRTASFEYDLAGNVTYHKDYSGVTTVYAYTPLNKVETKIVTMPSVTDGAAVVYNYSYDYDAEGNLTFAYHPDSVTWKYTYDGLNRLTRSEILGTNVARTFTYDKAGRRKTETDSAGGVTGFDYYADGQVALVTTPLGNTQNHYYDLAGRLNQISDSARAADIMTYERNSLGHVTSQTDGKGNTTQIGVNPLGQTNSLSIPNSFESRFSYTLDWRGNPLEQTDAEQGQVSFTYNAFGELASRSDSEGSVVNLDYDGLGRKIYEENNTGLRKVWTYVQDNQKLTITETQTDQYRLGYQDALRASTKVYDLMGRLVSYTDAQGQHWSFEYNLKGLLSRTVNPDGGITDREYNAAGQMTSLSETDTSTGEVRLSAYTYDGEGRVVTEKLPYYPVGTVNSYTYNASGQVKTVTLPDYSTIEYMYDEAGRRTDAYHPLGLTEHWTYDANDNLETYTDKDGYVWAYDYDHDNQLTTLCDPVQGLLGCTNVTSRQYDKLARLVSVTDANGNSQSQVLDTMGRVEEERDAYNQPVSYELDLAGRPVVITDRAGNRTQLSYNAFNEVIAVTDAHGYTTRFYYDKLGRVIERQDKLNESELWAYDFRDQIIQVTDKRSNTTDNQYNQFGNLTEVAQPIGSTQYSWNAANKVTSVTNPLNFSQSFEYDELARLESFTNEIGNTWSYDYNDLGQVTHAYQPEAGTDISYGYDGRGNMTSESYAYQGQNLTNEFVYDGAGRLGQISNAELTESYDYDAAGNLELVNNQTLGQSFSYGYDANNRRVYSQLSDAESTEYSRDTKGRISQISRDLGGATEVYDVSYDELDRITQIDYPNHSRRLVGYDAEGRVTLIEIEQETYQANEWTGSWSTVEVLEYDYDANGNVIAKNRKTSLTDSDQWAYFVYDELNRLKEADYPDNDDLTFIWDQAGNLTEKRSKTHAFTYVHNGANQITGFTGHRVTGQGCDEASQCQDDAIEDPKNNWFTYQYDDNGYPLSVSDSNGESVFEHDPLGRMSRVANSDNSDMRYGYDARGRKVRTERVIVKGKNESSTVLHTAFDGRQEFGQWLDEGASYSSFRSLTLIPQEQQGLPYGSVMHQKLYDTEHNLLKATGTEGADISHLYLHADNLNSIILVQDSTGTQAMRMGYSPFGQTFRKYTDGNSGLVLMDARWYNPHTARFVQPDYWNLRNTNLPAEIQHELMRFTGLNTNQLLNSPVEQMAFGYVKHNPLSWIDPFGLADSYMFTYDERTGEMRPVANMDVQLRMDATPQTPESYLATQTGADSLHEYDTFTQKDAAAAAGALSVLATPAPAVSIAFGVVSAGLSTSPMDGMISPTVSTVSLGVQTVFPATKPLMQTIDNLNTIFSAAQACSVD